MTKAQRGQCETIINPGQYLLELANAKACNALHGDSFTPARVAEIARQCVAERNELLEALKAVLRLANEQDEHEEIAMARAAIAKATGQAA